MATVAIRIFRNNIISVYQAVRHLLASTCKLLCEVVTELLGRKLLLSKPFPCCLLCRTSSTEFCPACGFSRNATLSQDCSNFNLQMYQPDKISQTSCTDWAQSNWASRSQRLLKFLQSNPFHFDLLGF